MPKWDILYKNIEKNEKNLLDTEDEERYDIKEDTGTNESLMNDE